MSDAVVEAEDTETDRILKSQALQVELNGDSIYLNYRQLVVLPHTLFDEDIRHSLHRLYLQHNLLRSVPPEIKELQQLRELHLQSNKLEALPEDLCYLPYLETLVVSNNQLTGIPCAICHLPNLRHLRMARNKLRQLPAEVGGLHQLQTLDVSHNQLRRLPPELSRCQNLQQLRVDSNQLVTLPPELCCLRMLTEISACSNQLVSLPQDLGRMPALMAVYVDYNSFLKAVPASTLNKTIGFCRSGQSAVPDHLMPLQRYIVLGSGQEEKEVIPLPPEVRSVGNLGTNCIPELLELSLRAAYKLFHSSGGSLQEGDLPADLQTLLHAPSGHCQHCGTQVFVSAFPIVFRAQVQTHSLLLLGLCCSARCVRQSSLVVHLPLLYPRLEDLALALVLV